jgi:hypothetical protein
MTCDSTNCFIRQSVPEDENSATGVDVFGLCAGEKFGPSATLPEGQHTAEAGYGTAFLVGPDLVATAAHAVDNFDPTKWNACPQIQLVFGYKADASGDAVPFVPKADVYSCAAVVMHSVAEDVAVLRLDRAVTGRSRLPFRRTNRVSSSASLLLIGHPIGLPLKVASGAVVKSNSAADFFQVNADSFHGNSGSPVWNAGTGVVEGIVSSGNDDFTFSYPSGDPDGCLKVRACADTGCSGTFEALARATAIQGAVPNQAPHTFGSSSIAVDPVYAQVVSGDFDGDGRSDILLYGGDGATDSLYYGKFDKSYDSVALTVPDGYGVPVVGDFDGDGLADVFWYRSGSGQDRIWWGRATRTEFGTSTYTRNMKQDGAGFSPFVADFDGNGGSDIFWYGRGSSAPAEDLWWSNKNRNGQPSSGTPTFTSQAQSIGGTAYYPVAGDFSGDGYADLYWFKPGATSGTMWWGTATHTFTTSSVALPSTITSSHVPLSGDFDGNGAVDIFYYAPGALADYMWWFKKDIAKAFDTTSFTVSGTYLPAVGDFNGDSATDVLWYGSGTANDSRWWGRL